MAFSRIKANITEIKKIIQLSRQAQKQVGILQDALKANQKDLAEVKRAVKRTQYQNQGHLNRIKEVQEKMNAGHSTR